MDFCLAEVKSFDLCLSAKVPNTFGGAAASNTGTVWRKYEKGRVFEFSGGEMKIETLSLAFTYIYRLVEFIQGYLNQRS